MEQHSVEWYKARLGRITGSQVGRLMKKGRSSFFGDDAMSYIHQLAFERSLSEEILNDDAEFEEYLATVNVATRAMRFGSEMEATARMVYCDMNDVKCEEVGLCEHFDIENFASSPDGIVMTDEGRVALEIKCPTSEVFMKYFHEVKDNETLKKVKPEYYYQCMAHMMCTGAVRTDFIVFNPFHKAGIKVIPILPDDEVFEEMKARIEAANELINEIV